ncbi:polyisoprenoid-binding protein YceI [Paenibacillus harenae]|uniref:Polyisoprenoid-binding protein YceI n=1 Tax=Paenibacillus harenae TaxID=306543 RepID=A0ABT9U1M3_PAEHA|nr:polyisoprenoid-binding protein YceI [Paenibacillus harenae]
MKRVVWTVFFLSTYRHTHSAVDFSVMHMMIAKVKGTFHAFEASITADPHDLTSAEIDLSIDLTSIDTRNGDRDAHLRSGDFFETEKYPALAFKATNIAKTDNGEYNVTGDVSLHGVTRSETFMATFEGAGKDPWATKKSASALTAVSNAAITA